MTEYDFAYKDQYFRKEALELAIKELAVYQPQVMKEEHLKTLLDTARKIAAFIQNG
jgi:hypothetical protein